MNTSRTLKLAALSLGLAIAGHGGTATAQTPPTPHTLSGTYLQWSYPGSFTTVETDLKFVADPGPSAKWFLSHQFELGDANGAYKGGGYIGLQTSMTSTGAKGVMFSIWNATVATPGNGATCQPFGGEGIGMQCFIAYPWVAGKTYRLRVVHENGAYSGYVLDTSTVTPTATYLGQIQAPAGTAGFNRSSVQWAEYYNSVPSNCAEYPYVKAVWSRPKGNGGAVLAASPTLLYNESGYCKNAAVLTDGSTYVMEAGTPAASTKQHLAGSIGKYVKPVVSTNACGGAGLKADGTTIQTCSGIVRVPLANGKVALQAENGNYLSCANGGGSTVGATARTVSNNEMFTETILSGKVSYKSYGGRYLSAASYGSLDLTCSAYFAGTAEKFTPFPNKARSASVTVSSESIGTSQQGIKAIDGSFDGYPGVHTREWVTNNENAGAWIQLQWSATTNVRQVILFDRPNQYDQILGGTLLFSDGSSVPVAALPNDGSPLSVSFTARNVTWVKFRVDNASGLVGLAEIEVY